MKKILILFGISGFLFFSCNKKLDIAPENTLVESEVFETESGAEQALSESYYDFLESVTNGFAYQYGDFTTPILNNAPAMGVYVSGQVTPTDYYVVNTWSLFFAAINSANNVIQKIPEFAKFSKSKQKQFIAEAKFIRAFCYFDLLCLYGDGAITGNMQGLGLPLQLTPFEGYNTGEVIPRSTNGEVIDQVIKDLNEAIPDLLTKFPESSKMGSRATKGSANALLSRVYLYEGDYQNAAVAAKAVLDLSPSVYVLSGNLLTVFPANPSGVSQQISTEDIFALPVSQMISTYTSLNNNIGSNYYFKRSYWINPSFINEFEPGDRRVSQLMWKGDSVYNPSMLNEKTTFKFNNPNGRDNIPVLRLPEVMLTRAEALARTEGINDESVQLLNSIRNRSVPGAVPYTVQDFGSKDDLISRILTQRKFELCFEGLYRYDLLRNHLPLADPDIPENKKVLPIPQSEIDISHNIIKQNSGY